VAGFPSQLYTSEVRLTVTQPLLRGAWSDYGLRHVHSGEVAAAGSEHNYQKSVQDTLLGITRAYWELVFARENYKVVFQALDLAREQLRITKERIRVRELADRDRVADEADVSRREEELLTAENLIRTREDLLRRLLYDNRDGLLWRRGLRPTSPIQEQPPVLEIDWRTCAEVAMRRRPDLMSRRAGISLAEIDLMAAERDILPRLDLVGSYADAGSRSAWNSAWSDTWGLVYPDWSLLLQFSLPIGNNQALSLRDRAKLVVEQRKRELYSAEMDAEREVREAVRELKTLALRTQAARESVRLADMNLDTERQKLRVGLSTAFEVQRRNQELMEARSRLLRNQLDHEIATAVLLHVQGLLAPAEPTVGEKRL
jgi:outer membrane protein TolC